MLHRFVFCTCFASLVLIAVMTISCGSSSSPSKPTCTGGPYDMVGEWDLIVDGQSNYPLPGVINTAGLAIFFKDVVTDPEHGSEVVMPSITGACSFSENLTLYSTPAAVGSGGIYTYPVQGTVQSGPAFSGTITEPGDNETFVGVPQSPFTPTALNTSLSLVDVDSPIACRDPQCVHVQVVPSGTGNSANMTLSGTDGFDCTLSGTFTQEGSNAANLNVFDVSLTFTGTTCQVTGTITGLGFESSVDYFDFTSYPPPGTLLYAMSANSAEVFEIFPGF